MTHDGFDIDVRLPWYRALPLSTYRNLTLKLDGEEIANDAMMLEVNGHSRPLDAADGLEDEMWHMEDSGTLHVIHAGLAPGKSYEVEVELDLQIPYAEGFVLSTQCRKTLAARGAEQ